MEKGIRSLWFIRLRWFAFLGQLLVLALAVGHFALSLPWISIAISLSLIPLSNITAQMSIKKYFSEKLLVGGLLALDTFILTAILCLAGGPTNPFTIVYLLHVVLAAVMLTPVWTWGIAILSSFGFGVLFLLSIPVPEWESHGAHHGLSLHLHGMLFAYIVVALLVAHFLSKIVGELQRKERKLQRLETLEANQQRLASLTTITANAAHELGTPLSTIAVVSHELGRMLLKRDADRDLLDDIALLKNETARCKAIIQELSERTGDLIGEVPQSLRVQDLLHDAIRPIKSDCEIKIIGSVEIFMRVPRKALVLAVRALVKNAVEATNGDNKPIEIEAQINGAEILLEIRDSGIGMDGEALERIGEPFFSTKGQGKGMGLGVYLSKLTVEQLGGSLVFKSIYSHGTHALMTFPIDCAQSRAEQLHEHESR